MLQFVLAVLLTFSISTFFSMFGKGGGELYLPVLLTLLNMSYFQAATLSLLMITLQGLSMIPVYSKRHGLLDWALALMLGGVVALSSFLGGFISYEVPASLLKLCFSLILAVSAVLILAKKEFRGVKFLSIRRRVGDTEYDLQILLIIPPVALAAFLAGMAGISGGGLIVPLCVILGGVPLRVAMATNSFLVISSSSMSLLGHVLRGGLDIGLGAVFGLTVVIGAQLGARMHTRIGDREMRWLFSLILLSAAAWMLIRTLA